MPEPGYWPTLDDPTLEDDELRLVAPTNPDDPWRFYGVEARRIRPTRRPVRGAIRPYPTNEQESPMPTPITTDSPPVQWTVHNRDADPGRFSQALRDAFSFFRRAADGKYTSTSLMRLLDAAEGGRQTGQPPVRIVEVGRPSSYDPDTEVKTGGVVGMAVVYESGRTMLAVAPASRGSRVGRTLLAEAGYGLTITDPLTLWIHQSNVGAQRFALACGLVPESMNGSGAIAYRTVRMYGDTTEGCQ